MRETPTQPAEAVRTEGEERPARLRRSGLDRYLQSHRLSDALLRSRILIVDDEEDNVEVLGRLLARAGFQALASTTDPRKAVDLFQRFRPDLVLLDLHMPHMDGFAVMERLQDEVKEGDYLPILVLTGDQDFDTRARALEVGAKDFLTKPFQVVEAILRIRNLLEARALHLELEGQNENLERKVRARTHELEQAQVEILYRLALAAEYRDDITGKHAARVGVLSALLAEELGLPEEEVELIEHAAPLHDVGKIGIPDSILMKPGPLTPEEFEVIKTHTTIGARILSGSRFPVLELAREIALHHHERWDGCGYVQGLGEDDIPLVGRIVAVADAYDSLQHERPYKTGLSMDEALGRVVRDRGTHFQPDLVDALLGLAESGRLEEVQARVLDRHGSMLEGRGLAWKEGSEAAPEG